ncbi:MAG: hypothetical protein M9938_10515 [Solirubrobacterales bacterium]|nr:hypothetical protein [Solirubrobacterales bacterium]
MIVCALLPLLTLRAALGRRQEQLLEPVAVAPGDGAPARIGEVSPAASSLGVRPDMRLGEAVDICPELGFIPPDPARSAKAHERLLLRLESIGAGVEPGRPGEAFFLADGLERLHGGPSGVLAATRRALGPAPVLAAAPTRLAAFTLAGREGPVPGRTVTLPAENLATFLAELPVSTLSGRLDLPPAGERDLFRALGRLNLDRLGDLTALSADQVADRFGPAGSRARKLALGREEDIRPRHRQRTIGETVELPEEASGTHLRSGLILLGDRVAAQLDAAGLSARSLVFEADLVEGGSWSRELTPRKPTASSGLFRLLLASVPERLPRPAESLRLRVTATAPAAPEQLETAPRPEETRRCRLDEAARQVRAAVGRTGLLRVLEAEPGSRLPERRLFLTPYLPE